MTPPAQWNLVNLVQAPKINPGKMAAELLGQEYNLIDEVLESAPTLQTKQPPQSHIQPLALESDTVAEVTVVAFASDDPPTSEQKTEFESTTAAELAKRAAAQESNLGFKAVYEDEDVEPLNFYELFPLGLYQNFAPNQFAQFNPKPTRAVPNYKLDFLRDK